MHYRWDLLSPEPSAVSQLTAKLGISPLLAKLLINRGVTDPAEATTFLNPSLDQLHDPFLMKDMDRVVARVEQAIRQREAVLIYGDYDVDGITATAILRRAIEMLGGRVEYHIPRRLEDGYGLRVEEIRKAAHRGIKVVISVDSGIRALEVAQLARQLSVDLVVTDHHLPGPELPDAYAILNPRQAECSYPDPNLAGVGVAFKLVDALFRSAGREEVTHHFLKLVAIGTVADMVPLKGENRVMVHFGLKALSEPYNLGLQALLQGSGVGSPVTHTDIGFKVAPRINAFTRMGGGGEIVDLFSLNDPSQARAMVEEMNSCNIRRRQEEDDMLAQVEEQRGECPELFERHFIVVSGRDWHRGVIGNVASRVAQRFHRPALVFSVSDDRCQASGRSIGGYHLLEALDTCKDMFGAYGGHAQAVGCTLSPEMSDGASIARLADRLNDHASSLLGDDDLVPTLQIDALLQPDDVSGKVVDEVELLAPFGVGNRTPLFSSQGLTVDAGPWLLKEQHLKLQTRCGNQQVDAIWWREGEVFEQVKEAPSIDLVYQLKREVFRGQENLLMTIRDLVCPTAVVAQTSDSRG